MLGLQKADSQVSLGLSNGLFPLSDVELNDVTFSTIIDLILVVTKN